MKRYIWITAALVIVISLILLLRAGSPEVLTVSRSVIIDANPRFVFAQMNDFRNWPGWSVWYPAVDESFITYHNGGLGTGGAVVFSDKEGGEKGEKFTIIRSDPHQSLELALDFRDVFSVHHVQIALQEGKSVVNWSTGFKNKGWSSIFFRLKTGRDLERSLASLANVAILMEKQNIKLVEPAVLEAFPYVSIRRQFAYDMMSDEMAFLFDQMIAAGSEGNFEITGHPFAIYHSLGDERVDVECGFPVREQVTGMGIIRSAVYEETNCAMLDYTGDYSTMEAGHAAIREWITVRGFELSGPPMEVYISPGGEIQDSSKWQTQICYPIAF